MTCDSCSTVLMAGSTAHHGAVSTLPRTAATGAIVRRRSRMSGGPTSPAWMMSELPASASSASGRRRPCVSEITPIGYSGGMMRRFASTISSSHPLRAYIVALGLVAAAAARDASAQDSTLKAERVVPFVTGKTATLDAKVGPVLIQTVAFSDRGRGTGSGLPGIGRPTPPETSTTIRAHFVAENPSADEWEVTFTLELLDKAGKLIDRVVKKGKWEGRSKP